MLITIVELPEFQKRSEKILSKDERDELLYHLSANPKSVDLTFTAYSNTCNAVINYWHESPSLNCN